MPATNRFATSALSLAALCAATAFTGCSGMVSTTAPTALAGVAMTGTVHGGQQPVTGAHVYLFATGTSGYGSASTSLLNIAKPGVTADPSGNGYVTTDASGSFTVSPGASPDYLCPSANQPVYFLALGGNPGLSTTPASSGISLIAAPGACGNLTTTTNVVINEVSTAAAVTALQQFTVDSTHIGTSTTNAAGLSNAFIAVSDVVTLATGVARTRNVNGNGTVSNTTLNTLGDILAPCINSTGNGSSACQNLYSAATPPAGTAPADTVAAMLNIAQFPTNNRVALYQQINAQAPFQPILTSAPNDYTLSVTLSGGGLVAPGLVVIDKDGNAWTASCPTCSGAAGTDSIVGFNPQGVLLSGTNGFTTNIHKPQGIAFDVAGGLWSVNQNTGTVADEVLRTSSSGVVQSGFPLALSTVNTPIQPLGIAVDSINNAWISQQGSNNAAKVSAAGAPLGVAASAGFSTPTGIGIDGSGNIFMAGTGSSSILKFTSNGTISSGPGAGYTGGGLAAPIGISIDNGGRIWTIDNIANPVSIIKGSDGSAVSPSNGYQAGLFQAAVIAIDGAGTAWIANCRAGCPNSGSNMPDSVAHLAADGTVLNTIQGLQNTNFATVGTAAIDSTGNLWVSNNTAGTLTVLLGVAVPVKTPIAIAANANQLGARP